MSAKERWEAAQKLGYTREQFDQRELARNMYYREQREREAIWGARISWGWVLLTSGAAGLLLWAIQKQKR